MKVKGIGLGLLLLMAIAGAGVSETPRLKGSLSVTLGQLQRLKASITPNESPVNPNITAPSPDLEQSEVVKETEAITRTDNGISSLQSSSPIASKAAAPSERVSNTQTILQSVKITSAGIVLGITGRETVMVRQTDKVTGKIHILLERVVLAPGFKIITSADSGLPKVKISQISTNPAIAEILLESSASGWQVVSREGELIIVQGNTNPNLALKDSSTVNNETLPTDNTSPVVATSQQSPENTTPELTSKAVVNTENSPLPEDKSTQIIADVVQTETPPPALSAETTISSPETSPENPIPAPETVAQSSPETPASTTSADDSPTDRTDENKPSKIDEPSVAEASKDVPPLTPLQLPPTELINLETANVLPQGSISTSYGVHLFPKGQYGGGTGLQTYNISIEGGVTDNLQLGLDWVLFDDTLGQKINGNVPELGVMSFAPKFKYQFLKEEDFSLALSGSLEIGKFTGSYGLYTPNNLQQTSTTLNGTLELPFTYNLTSNLQWHLVPGVIFFPSTINNGGDFYGTFFNVGTGFNYSPMERLTLFADVNLPVGSGGNAVNSQGQIVTKPVWAAGLTYLHSPTVGIDLYATNALGATPATQTLAFIPNGGQVAAGVNLRYTPDIGQRYPSSFRAGPRPVLTARDRQLLFNGINLSTAETLPAGTASIQGGSGNRGSFQLSYGMSDDAELQLTGQQLSDSNTLLSKKFEIGIATKLRFLSQTDGDPISLSLIGGAEEGTSNSSPGFQTGVGLFTTELALSYQLSPQFAMNFNPKAGFFGGEDIIGTGLGLNFQPFTGVQLIGEVTPILTGNNRQTIWSGALRYIYPEWNVGIDLYATNGAGTYGIGGLIPQAGNYTNLGFNLLWLFGGDSKQISRTNPTDVPEPLNSEPLSLEPLSLVPQSSVEPLTPQNLTGEQTSTVSVAATMENQTLSLETSKSNSSESSTTETNPLMASDSPSEKPLGDSPLSQEPLKKSRVGNFYLTFSPVSWHLDDIKSKVNNFPMGIGAAYDFEVLDGDYGFFNWFLKDSIMNVEFNVFRDSNFGYPSAYAGVGIRKNIFDLPLQTGTAMGLIYTTQLQELSGFPVLPFVLSFIQTDFEFPLNLRVIYIPSISDFKSQQIFFTIFGKVN